MSGSSGSGLFAKMVARLQHLLNAGGLPGEVADVRKDVAVTLGPLVAVTVEEYDYPPAAGAIVLLGATLSTLTSLVTYKLNGNTGIALSPPRNVEVIVAGSGTATHMSHSVTVTGLDVNGNAISETIAGTNGGAATYAGVKCFARVLTVTPAADGGGVDATFSVANGVVIGLAQPQKLRTGQTLGLIRRELVDGAAPSAGALTAATTNAPNGAYTPVTAPTTQAPATTSGSVDMTTAGLYGGAGTLDGTQLWIDVNGAGSLHLVLSGTGNAADEPTLLAAIAAEWPALVVTTDPTTHFLVLTTSKSDTTSQIIIAADGSSTANPFLGLTAGTYNGAGHRYAIEYEYDASQQKNATIGF